MAFAGSAGGGEMAGFFPAKVKRKDLDDVYDEFSEFSLYSPARKIRRLDVELPPIMEEEEPAIRQLAPPGVAAASESLLRVNEERALVLYKPVRSPLLESPGPSNACFRVDSDLIAGFKSNQAFWPGRANLAKLGEEEEEEKEKEAATFEEHRAAAHDECLAVVPWVSSLFPGAGNVARASASGGELAGEPMESDEREVAEVASMDVEEENGQGRGAVPAGGGGWMRGSDEEGLLLQQQQHCMSRPPHPQLLLPQNTTSAAAPVVWFR